MLGGGSHRELEGHVFLVCKVGMKVDLAGFENEESVVVSGSGIGFVFSFQWDHPSPGTHEKTFPLWNQTFGCLLQPWALRAPVKIFHL